MLELDLKVSLWLRRKLAADMSDDGPYWRGISCIRQAAGLPKTKDAKVETRAALDRLIDAGHVLRSECSSGVFYRASGPDYIRV